MGNYCLTIWFTDDIGWDDQDMRANRLGINFGEQLRTQYGNKFKEDVKAVETKKSSN